MSNIIRAVTAPWTPPPQPRSSDAPVASGADPYRFIQNEIESAQRQNQNAMNRSVRASNINAAPKATELAHGTNVIFPSTILALLIK